MLSGNMKNQAKIHVSIFIPESGNTLQDVEFKKWVQCREPHGSIDNSVSGESKFIFNNKVDRAGNGDFSWAQTSLLPNKGVFEIKLKFSELACCTHISLVKEGVQIKPYFDEEKDTGVILFTSTKVISG
jgi:hypothetical protein